MDHDLDGYRDGVLSTLGYDYGFLDGTSMAAPHVAGVVALMKAVNPELTPRDVDQLLAGRHPGTSLRITEDQGQPGRDDHYGHGLIDALNAVQAALQIAGIAPGDDDGTPQKPTPEVPGDSGAPPTVTTGDTGTLYVVVVDPLAGHALAGTAASAYDDYAFRIANVTPGQYLIVAGTDLDGNGTSGGTGEVIGAFPNADEPVTVDASRDVHGLTFEMYPSAF